jgi:hypothetical protein
VIAAVIPADPMVTAVVPAAVPAVVRTMLVKPVGTATPVIGFAISVFFVNAMVPVLVVIMAIDMRPRRVTRRVIVTLVLAMSAVGWFACVAVRLCGIAEGKAGNTQYQSGNVSLIVRIIESSVAYRDD